MTTRRRAYTVRPISPPKVNAYSGYAKGQCRGGTVRRLSPLSRQSGYEVVKVSTRAGGHSVREEVSATRYPLWARALMIQGAFIPHPAGGVYRVDFPRLRS